jgi:nucleoside-diphosphate-sugar epimerase
MLDARRILVTGAQGLLGSHVVQSLLNRQTSLQVLGVGRSPQSNGYFTYSVNWGGVDVPAPIPSHLLLLAADRRYEYQPLDLIDRDAVTGVITRFDPDLVIHCAAALRDDPLSALVISNLETVAVLIESAAECPEPPRVVVVSSGSVYGATSASALPIHESEPCAPLDLYAATKRAAEDIARIEASRHGLWLATARVFNLLGPGLQDRHLAASLAGQLMAIALEVAGPVVSVGPLNSTRDFVDVRDAAAAVLQIGEHGSNMSTYNVASGAETPVQQVFDFLVASSGTADVLEIRRHQDRAADYDRSYADITALLSLGYAPTTTLEQSLSDMLCYYRDSFAGASAH